MEKLVNDVYKTRVTAPELKKMLNGIPAEIQLMDGLKDVSQTPKKTYQLLKDKNYLPNISYDQRQKLITQAKTILRPQITKEFKNYIAAREAGKEEKELPRFDFKMVNEIFTEPEAEKIMVVKEMADNNANNVNFFHSLKN